LRRLFVQRAEDHRRRTERDRLEGGTNRDDRMARSFESLVIGIAATQVRDLLEALRPWQVAVDCVRISERTRDTHYEGLFIFWRLPR
jgi:hypothetical protein